MFSISFDTDIANDDSVYIVAVKKCLVLRADFFVKASQRGCVHCSDSCFVKLLRHLIH